MKYQDWMFLGFSTVYFLRVISRLNVILGIVAIKD